MFVPLSGLVQSKDSALLAHAAVLLGKRSPSTSGKTWQEWDTSHIEGRMNTHVQTAWHHLCLPGEPHKHRHLQGYDQNKLINRMSLQKISPLKLGLWAARLPLLTCCFFSLDFGHTDRLVVQLHVSVADTEITKSQILQKLSCGSLSTLSSSILNNQCTTH